MAKKPKYKSPLLSSNEYDPVLEEKVKYYTAITPDLPVNTVKPKRSEPPDTVDPYEIKLWQKEEIRRIKKGHFGMTPKMYFWYNYVKIWDVEHDSVFKPEYRVCQQEWFKQIEEVQASKEWGLICVKRRRVGASWLEAADALHDCITRPLFKVGMTSKTAEDAVELFKKVKFIYDNLPGFMRPTSSAGNTLSSIDFSFYVKDATGSKQKKGLQSEIRVKAPTDTSWEGYALKKWVADESGKIGNLKNLFSMTQEVMRKGFRRVGTPILFGTAGDIGKEGRDLKDMWYNADIHKFRKFFFGGWMGVDGFVDEYGNDLKEEAIRWIIYERKRLETLSTKEYNDFLQQYPLTVQEAFTSNDQQGLGNQAKINTQLTSLAENPVKTKRGYFRLDTGENVVFVPDNRGECIIFDDPQPGVKNTYVSGVDPTDHEVEDTKNASSLSMFILQKQSGLTPPKIVFEYTDRPNVPRDYYEQALMALIYYNDTKVLIERNKAGMITYFDERGFKHLLQTSPQGLTRLIASNTFSVGLYLTKSVKKYTEELIEEYIEDFCELIPSRELLEEFKDYGVANTDRVSALAMALVMLREDKSKARTKDDRKFAVATLKRQNGKLVYTR
jgi:hypothetical protein